MWEFNVGAPIGIGGSSVAHGMLFVPTTNEAELKTHKSGSKVAFRLPDGEDQINPSEEASNTTIAGNATVTRIGWDLGNCLNGIKVYFFG